MEHSDCSLVNAAPGDAVRIRQILFDSLRAYCSERGVRDGDRVSLMDANPTEVAVRVREGPVVRCPSEFARFVEVAPEGS